jgi:hypothetical protein
MFLLNFSHPLTPDQLAKVEALSGQAIEQVIPLTVQFDPEQSFLPQLQVLFTQIPLTSEELQTRAILVNPPALNVIAVLLLAELHGRMGYFPPVVRLRPVAGSLPPRYEVAEILNLQAIRDEARKRRYEIED